MAWDATFRSKMTQSGATPIFRFTAGGFLSESDPVTWVTWAAGILPPKDATLAVIDTPTWWGTGRTRDTTFYRPDFRLDPLSIRLPEQRLDFQNFACSGGQWLIELEHPKDTNVAWLAAGAVASLSMGFPGDTHEDFRRVALGRISAVTWTGDRLRVVCDDLLAYLNGDRPHDGDPFGKRNTTSGLASSYTAGDSTISLNTTVPDSVWEADKDGIYTLVGVPDGADPFVLTATGKTDTGFTGVSATGEYGTTAVDIPTGGSDSINIFRNAWRAEGNPMNVVRNLLVSTGEGTNGTYDVEPFLMGYGVPNALVDSDDIDVWLPAIAPDTGAFQVDFLVARLADDSSFYPDTLAEGLREILQRLGPCGVFAVARQGQLTCRALQDLNSGSPITTSVIIKRRHIIGLEIDWWPREQAQEFRKYTVTTEDGGASSYSEDAVFAGQAQYYDVDASFIRGNQEAVRDSIVARVAPWITQRVERLRLLLAGNTWAQLCPGDVVTLQITEGDLAGSLAKGRTAATYLGYDGVLAMVTAIQWHLPRPCVSLEVCVLPPDAGEMPAI